MKSLRLLIPLLLFLCLIGNAQAADLRGRVLLQADDKGQAWYINPLDGKRYSLGRPDAALKVMRSLGLGVKSDKLDAWRKYRAPRAYSGRIVLDVENLGEAYYINPLDQKLYFLGSPAQALEVMSALGLGVYTADLNRIALAVPTETVKQPEAIVADNTPDKTAVFSWHYGGKDYALSLQLKRSRYESYAKAQKYYESRGPLPADWHERYYGMFLTPQAGDKTIPELTAELKRLAAANNLSEDQLVELTATFVQSIPYDSNKNLETETPYYPYETLYLNRGVCTDKTLLLSAIYTELGYGTAIYDFPDVNHAAVGIACPAPNQTFNEGYCYVETTNFFPVGAIPQEFGSNGVSDRNFTGYQGQFNSVFDPTRLGKYEIYRQTQGKLYTGEAAVRSKVEKLKNLEKSIADNQTAIRDAKLALDAKQAEVSVMQANMEAAKRSGDIAGYNNLVAPYNSLVAAFNAARDNYNGLISIYNGNADLYNGSVKDFYSGGK